MVFTLPNGSVHCLVQGFHCLETPDGQPLLNKHERPLLELSNMIYSTSGSNVMRAVSIVHECGGTCTFRETTAVQNIERMDIAVNKLVFNHDWNNTMYCYNVYCML